MSISRRQFLACTGAAGAMGLLDGMSTARALTPANNRIQVALIGLGGMNRAHLTRLIGNPRVQVVAGCDPDAHRQADAAQWAGERGTLLRTCADYREMLHEHPGIDAVWVATPDHWHARASMDCMAEGKDVYCEKPLALTIEQGRRMVATARRHARVLQVGTMQRSDMPQFRHACELVRNGHIGALEKVVCHFGANPRATRVPDETPPPWLDWDLYLGSAPWRPYNPLIHPYTFRYMRDFSGGLLTDWGVHLFDIAQWGMGKDHTSPRRIEGQAEYYEDNAFDFPRTARIQYDYGDCLLEWHQDAGETIEPGTGYGTKFIGTEGEVFVNRSVCRARDRRGKTLDPKLDDDTFRLQAATNHHDDFLDAVETRRRPICDVAIGHRATAIAHLGNIALRLGRPLTYDPERECFPGDAMANRLFRGA